MATTEPKKSVHNSTNDWVGFPTSTFLNPIPSPYNFTNPLSKTVLLIADSNYVSKHVVSYLDTTLHVSGFKVTKYNSISSAPLFWTEATHHENKTNDDFWEYRLKLSDFDSILIPSQIHGNLWNDISPHTKLQFKQFVEKGGSLICCHFRGTEIINEICDVSWHEISVKMGASHHCAKENDILQYKNDVRGIVNIDKEDIIYHTKDDFTTVARRVYGNGCCYYIGHDFNAIWEKTWNKILFHSIKKTLTNSDEEIMNLSFGNIDIEAFKNLNIESNRNGNEVKDIYLEEFEPDFKTMDEDKTVKEKEEVQQNDDMEQKTMTIEDAQKSFDGFDDLNDFSDDKEEVLTPQTAREYEEIGYVQMDDDGVITINDSIKFKVELPKSAEVEMKTINEDDEVDSDDSDNESLEEVD